MTMLEQVNYRQGIRKTGALSNIVAALTPITLYTLSTGRTCELKRLHIHNGNAANALLDIGTGLGGLFIRALPRIFLNAGMDIMLTEADLVNLEFTANITCQADVGGADPAWIQLRAEVEEYQGPNG